jgi:hypothetical protein
MSTRTIKIKTTRTYTRTAVVEIPCPNDNDGYPIALDEVADFLHDNEDLYQEKMDNALSEAELEGEFECDDTRYDVIETVTLNKKVYGGTL